MSFFISDALAAATSVPVGQGQQSESLFSLIMIVAIFALFYLILIRPQNKRAKEHRTMVNSVKKGDEIVISGGILAKVVNLDDQFIKVNIAEGIEIHVQRGAINTILPKGTIKSL